MMQAALSLYYQMLTTRKKTQLASHRLHLPNEFRSPQVDFLFLPGKKVAACNALV